MTERALTPVMFLLLTSSLVAADYFVAPTGTDRAPGTSAAPFLTIQRALDAARRPGDTVIVAGGTYRPLATINLSNPGREGPDRSFSRAKSILNGPGPKTHHWHFVNVVQVILVEASASVAPTDIASLVTARLPPIKPHPACFRIAG